ncbi:hypothetical protein V1515DRAFT_608408 [Lipomyces mesembrius]
MARLHVAHIIPFSASHRIPLRFMLSSLLTSQGINNPSNSLLLDATTHEAFDAFKF